MTTFLVHCNARVSGKGEGNAREGSTHSVTGMPQRRPEVLDVSLETSVEGVEALTGEAVSNTTTPEGVPKSNKHTTSSFE